MPFKRKCLNLATDILGHLESKPNQSFYINNLIRNDIKNIENLTKDDIIKLIQTYLSQNNNNQLPIPIPDLSESINNILNPNPKGE